MAIPLGNDLGKVETEDFAPLEPGEYLAYVENAEETTSNGGNDMLKLTVKTVGNEEGNNRTLFHYLVFGYDHSLEAAKRLMTALKQDVNGMTQIEAVPLIGQPCKIQVKHDTYEGKLQHKIHYFHDSITEDEEARIVGKITKGDFTAKELDDLPPF